MLKPTILVVDDMRINRMVLREIFSEQYDVIEAEDGDEAIRILHNDVKIDMILLDINMPNQDGFAVLEYRKKYPHISKIPVYVNCEKEEEWIRRKATGLGATGFIVKPYDSREVRKKVGTMVW